MDVKSEWVDFKWYREFVTEWSSEQMSIYHSTAWLEAVAEAFDAEICAVHTRGTGGLSLAVTPFMVKYKGPFRLIGSPLSGLYTEFAGPLFSNCLSEAEVLAGVPASSCLAGCALH